MDVYCKSQGQSFESWLTYVGLVKLADMKLGSFPKNVRSTYKRGVTQFCKQGKAKLAKIWLAFEQQAGSASSIQQCQRAIRKFLPDGLNEKDTAIDNKPQEEIGA